MDIVPVFWPIADAARCGRPSGCRLKAKQGREAVASALLRRHIAEPAAITRLCAAALAATPAPRRPSGMGETALQLVRAERDPDLVARVQQGM
jgi:hypothetical protein